MFLERMEHAVPYGFALAAIPAAVQNLSAMLIVLAELPQEGKRIVPAPIVDEQEVRLRIGCEETTEGRDVQARGFVVAGNDETDAVFCARSGH
jgi:hypothetical protein